MVTLEDLWAMGDANRDGVIDDKDVEIVALAFGTTPDDPYWNPDADFNQDGVVDVLDAILVSTNWGMKADIEGLDVMFPSITIPQIKIPAGLLLNVWLLGVNFKIPPIDITLIPKMTLINPFQLFSFRPILDILLAPVRAIPKLVWDFLGSWLQGEIDKYYKAHPEERE